MYKFTIIDIVSLFLILICALNQGLYGISDFNLIEIISGGHDKLVGRIVYILVGVSGIDIVIFLMKTRNYSSYK
ncbi:DUF378 domain-containing protein [Clostridium tyrobutyricum]|uniref:DUF378 domain-containing protein n=1 Tax=Clostridium tyrobutyricum TaxID=1519 RepID=UPI00057FFFDD|nr:DUF378 domain-containing protein [Clostridium tyrobutyricum]